MLLGEPALGRRAIGVRPGAHRPMAGQRYFRVRMGNAGSAQRRPRRWVSVHLHPTARRLRITVRLSRRRARALQARLQRAGASGQRDLPGVLTAFARSTYPT